MLAWRGRLRLRCRAGWRRPDRSSPDGADERMLPPMPACHTFPPTMGGTTPKCLGDESASFVSAREHAWQRPGAVFARAVRRRAGRRHQAEVRSRWIPQLGSNHHRLFASYEQHRVGVSAGQHAREPRAELGGDLRPGMVGVVREAGQTGSSVSDSDHGHY